MSTVLRAPHIVPSLFGRGVDDDATEPCPVPMGRRLADGLARLRQWPSQDADAAIARFIPALLCSSALLELIGKPLVRAAALAIGLEPL